MQTLSHKHAAEFQGFGHGINNTINDSSQTISQTGAYHNLHSTSTHSLGIQDIGLSLCDGGRTMHVPRSAQPISTISRSKWAAMPNNPQSR